VSKASIEYTRSKMLPLTPCAGATSSADVETPKQSEVSVDQEECDISDGFESAPSKSIDYLENMADLELEFGAELVALDQELLSQALVILEQLESEGRYSFCEFVAATHKLGGSLQDNRWKLIMKWIKRLKIVLKERYNQITFQCEMDLLKAFLECMIGRESPDTYNSNAAFCFTKVLGSPPRSCL
jgi:hypothetical protein